jgi:phosphoribosylanthranilate isomerase
MFGVSGRQVQVKFCGITRLSDASAALAAGAWAIGMVFYPRSPRAVDLDTAAEIAAEAKRHAEIVGVFVNPSLDEVATVADTVGLTVVQLHGQEGPIFCGEIARRTGCKVIKAARVHSGAEIQALAAFHTDFHLLDTFVDGVPGGTGESFNWELARKHPSRVPLILSGGLTPANVAGAIEVVRPFAVDVSSGIERAPGIKDHALIREFAEAVAGPDDSPSAPDGLAPAHDERDQRLMSETNA